MKGALFHLKPYLSAVSGTNFSKDKICSLRIFKSLTTNFRRTGYNWTIRAVGELVSRRGAEKHIQAYDMHIR